MFIEQPEPETTVRHIKSGRLYQYIGTSKIKLLGSWSLVHTYENPEDGELYHRFPEDFLIKFEPE